MFLLDRHRVGKHIAGHPLSYAYTIHPRMQPEGGVTRVASEPMTSSPGLQGVDLVNLRKPQTMPAGISNSNSPISPLDLPPLTPPSLGPTSNADLENQSTRSSQKPLHWWNKKRTQKREPRQHSPATAQAHLKTPFQLFKEIMFSSYANLLLVFIPVGIALHFVKVNPTVVFVMNFLAIIPLAGLLSFATEEIALKVGQVLGGLMNATFGNAVELIVSIIALIQGKVVIVQASLLGSMLSNLLLVLGMCFFFGGLRHKEQEFNMTVPSFSSSCYVDSDSVGSTNSFLIISIGDLILANPSSFPSFNRRYSRYLYRWCPRHFPRHSSNPPRRVRNVFVLPT